MYFSSENVLRLPLYYILIHKYLAVIVYASALSQITFFNSAIFICHYFILKLHLVYIVIDALVRLEWVEELQLEKVNMQLDNLN